VECGRLDDGARGWTLRLDSDDELQAFCPGCRVIWTFHMDIF
jgi:hypothetical protein